jgi:UTP:GlnB (protein PII) uridylyltransferase
MQSQHNVGITRVWFADDSHDGASELFVETPDRLGILFAVVSTIIAARIKILKSEANIGNGLARDWFLVSEADGRPVGAARRAEVRDQVLMAIATWRERGAA